MLPTTQHPSKPEPGDVVRCRTRRYLVEDLQAPPQPHGDTVVAMACMEDDAIGSRLTVFREREIDFSACNSLQVVSRMISVDRIVPQEVFNGAYIR